jgi:hypothetical protein
MGMADHQSVANVNRPPVELQWSGKSDDSLRHIVTGIVDIRGWHSGFAECVCPSCGRIDAALFCDGRFPIVYCFSTGCAAHNATVNAEMVSRTKRIVGESGVKIRLTPQEKAQIQLRRDIKVLEAKAKNLMLPQLLLGKPVPKESWLDVSPYPVADLPVEQHWKALLSGLFEQEDFVPVSSAPDGVRLGHVPPLFWIGELYETGSSDHAVNFKTVVAWLAKGQPYGPQISVCSFKTQLVREGRILQMQDHGSRTKEWVEKKDYLVAESDSISPEQFGLVIRWIQGFATLRAIVDTGNKSLHCWFDIPAPPKRKTPPAPAYTNELWASWGSGGREEHDRLWKEWKNNYKAEIARDEWASQQFFRRKEEFYAILRGLGCDGKMFGLASTARLPGVERRDKNGTPTGRWQQLLFLNPKFSISI